MTDTLFIYLIKSTFTIIVLFGGYSLFLRKETYFGFNRFYLLFIIAATSLLPLFSYNVVHPVTETLILPDALTYTQLSRYTLEEVVIYAGNNPYDYFTQNNLSIFLTTIFLAGFAMRMLLFISRLLHLHAKIRKNETKQINGLTFVLLPQDSPTHSFFRWVFVNRDFTKEADFEKVIAHEHVHAKQKHSIDLLIAEIFTAVFWFNPLAYMLKKRIKENHEFLADQSVMQQTSSYALYNNLLFKYSSDLPTNILTHNFSYSLLKRRLLMMKKPKRPLRFGLGVMFITALIAGVLFACSSPEQKQEQKQITDDQVFKTVENPPEFPGGMDSLMKYLASNIRYPEQARKDSIQGRVYINFVVEKDGSAGQAKVLRGIGGGCDEEALRVINGMPRWKPGTHKGETVRVSFNLPVNFTLAPIVKDSVYTLVDTMPEFPGGMKALLHYLSTNIKYPEQAKKDSVQGRVFVNFIIEKDGSIGPVKLLRGIDDRCDEEALRVIRNMPDWEPGLKNGKPIRFSYNIPIKFALN